MTEEFTTKTPEFNTVVAQINKLREEIKKSQNTLDQLRMRYSDVIHCQNMKHEIEANEKLIEKLNQDRNQLLEQRATRRTSQNNQNQQNNQIYQSQQMQNQNTIGNQFSNEALIVQQIVNNNQYGLQLQLIQEGSINSISNFVQTQPMNDVMLMWKTSEGYYCGGIIKYGLYLSCFGGNVYSFKKKDETTLQGVFKNDESGNLGLMFDNCICIFDNYLNYTREIDNQYQSPNCKVISPLMSGQPQQDNMTIPIEKFLVFRV